MRASAISASVLSALALAGAVFVVGCQRADLGTVKQFAGATARPKRTTNANGG